MSDIGIIIFSILAVVGGAAMLIFHHPMRMALSLVSVMLSLAMVYGFMHIPVLAIGQVLIYVGAVMILMIYVIMLIDVRDISVAQPLNRLAWPTLILGTLMSGVIIYYFRNDISLPYTSTENPIFTFRNFAQHFLGEYWLFFELASVLLLVATVAAVAILQMKRREEEV